MTRKKMIAALSIVYIISGLWNIVIFLHQATVSSGFINLDLTRLIGAALAIYVGFHLLQWHDLGRRFAIILLWVRVAINSYLIIWFLSHREDVVSSGLYFLEKELYRTANHYAAEIFLVVWILIALIMIVFLSQAETKKMFTLMTSNDPNVIIESP